MKISERESVEDGMVVRSVDLPVGRERHYHVLAMMFFFKFSKTLM